MPPTAPDCEEIRQRPARLAWKISHGDAELPAAGYLWDKSVARVPAAART